MHLKQRLFCPAWVAAMLLAAAGAFSRADLAAPPGVDTAPGLRVSFLHRAEPAAAPDISVLPRVALYVPAGQPPTPWLPPGPFQAVWEGFISVEVRDSVVFQVQLNGAVELEVNGAVILATGPDGGAPGLSKRVRLNKGPNALRVTFTSPEQGDSFIRLHWQPRDSFLQPVPDAAFSHSPGDTALARSLQIRHGRELYLGHQCHKCHAQPATKGGDPELAADAPSLDAVGSRLNQAWLARWILNPRALNPRSTMPALLTGDTAAQDAAAIAAFLASLRGDVPATVPEPGGADAGRKLFDTLHCAGCHDDAAQTGLGHVREKFTGGALAEYLREPGRHHPWTRMPDFGLSAAEAAQLASWLNSSATAPEAAPPHADPALIKRGRDLVQDRGCLNCHSLPLENRFTAGPLDSLAPERWVRGCLDDAPPENSPAPRHNLTASGRAALRAFGESDLASLSRRVPAEYAERHSSRLNCAGCHGQLEAVPSLDILGAKLKPEWAARFIAGEEAGRPRPWLEARMPAFPKFASGLARGMAVAHGFPPDTPADPAPDPLAADLGRKLVSADGGFSCVACHLVGPFGAGRVFESPGINLALAPRRLLPDYFYRWMRNPQLIDPQTKMPVYFDAEGRSPLVDVCDGDADRQIHALWEYLRLGYRMSPPGAP